MKKVILTLTLLIFISSFVTAGSCWYVRNLSSNPSASWQNSSPESITIGDNTWDRIVLPNDKLTLEGFGSYNRLCDNGVSDQSLNYVILEVKNDKRFKAAEGLDGFNYSKIFTNTSGNGPAASLGLYYCSGDRFNVPPSNVGLLEGSTRTNVLIGMGTQNRIEFNVLNEFGPEIARQRQFVGGYTVKASAMTEPRAGEYGERPSNVYSESFFFAPPPSVFIMPLGDDILGFYEKDGYYEKEVFYTIKAQTYLNLTIKNIEINCSGGAECEIDPQGQSEYTMGYNNDVLIVSAIIRIPKNDIPKTITYNLSLDYDVTNLREVGEEYRNISIESILSRLDVGYLDQQDFQIKIIGSPDDSACEGYDGLIGSTGEVVAPRINVRTDFEDGFDYEMCSPENDDWVYCSQRELLVTLANKVAEIFELYIRAQQESNDSERNEIYQEINEKKSFEIYTRNLDLDRIHESFEDNQELFLEDPLILLEGDTKLNNIARARSLFESTSFFRNTGLMNLEIDSKFDVGKYQVDIQIGSDGTAITDFNLDASEIHAEFLTNYLFDDDDNLIDPHKVNLKINFKEAGGEPLLNWFFYEVGVENLDQRINHSENNFYNTQVNKRGQVLNFEQDIMNFEVDNIEAYPSFAIPIFTKVQKNDELINSFKINNISPVDNIRTSEFENQTFSYWSGFASSLEEGCGELLEDETSLVYRLEDRISEIDPNAQIFGIALYPDDEDNLQTGTQYLQTVIYSPILSSSENPLTFDINHQNQNVFNKNGICQNNNNCRITKDNSNHIVNWNTSLQDIINGIKNETICVTAQHHGTSNTVNWILFWNENKIISELTPTKREIINNDSESKICEGLPERTPEIN